MWETSQICCPILLKIFKSFTSYVRLTEPYYIDRKQFWRFSFFFLSVCTQPRRISAIGVAERVAAERVERIGNVVGYQIRLESKMSSSTRLLFCTTGILLRRLESDPDLTDVTHVIVDEVHERSEESDFLLMILRDLVRRKKDLRILLMSATLNANLFAGYFGSVPVIDIPGRTFPVDQIFLEEIIDMTGYCVEPRSQFAKVFLTFLLWDNPIMKKRQVWSKIPPLE